MTFLSPFKLKETLPLSPNYSLQIQKSRKIIQEILQGNSSLWAIALGPCSLHNFESAIEYAQRIKELQKKVESTCLLVMRAYVEKPRSSLGWKGYLYDHYLDGSNKIQEGLFKSRELYLKITDLEVPIATEFLEPMLSSYLSDLVSWGFIGARTSSSQIHRQLASSLPMPIGFKNSVEGCMEGAIQGINAANHPHHFVHLDSYGSIGEMKSSGNPHCHLVLRGTQKGPNYSSSDIEQAANLLNQKNLPNRLLIDCAHDNSFNKPFDQTLVCQSILKEHLYGNPHIMGIMIESHLKEGNQSIHQEMLDPSISVTDPCLDFEKTEKLILSIHEALLEAACLL